MQEQNKDPAFLMKKAAQKIAELQNKIDQDKAAQHEPIAVIGMGCRVPGADDPAAFWQLLCDGVDVITEVPDGRWDKEAHYDPDRSAPGKMYTRAGGFIDHLDTFDPLFFNMAPREAVSLDPQQRALLEVTWEALEHAAIATPPVETGVFVSTGSMEYLQYITQQGFAEIDTYFSSGNSANTASGRLSYILGLNGPCLTLDTACSSSLVAVHLACQNLRQGKCDMALAGGSNRIVMPTEHISFCKGEMLSPDGRCKTFDASANGFVRSEGCGVVVLKRLSDAQAARDNILAVVHGSAINHDGRTSGLTVPHGPAQQDVIRAALADAQLKPNQVGYIEAHGTGTKLGDPIEVEALGEVFGQREQPLVIGSVKSTIGHLEAAAGIAGFMKAVLAIQHSAIPPNLHFKEPNPFIDWDNLPVQVPTKLQHWSQDERVAGVSSFGFSGTNAHIVLGQAPSDDLMESELAKTATDPNPVTDPQLLTLSAKTLEALHALARRYADYVQAHPEVNLADLCFTANTGRQHFHHRVALVAESSDQLLAQLSSDTLTGYCIEREKRHPVAFLFTGQGAQYVNMGRDLYVAQPVFRQALNDCAALLAEHLDVSILHILYPIEGAENANTGDIPDQAIDLTLYTQPILFALEYALAQLWQSWGIQPDFVLGHSVGEYTAACVAGVFSLADGCTLITARARLMAALPPAGAMVAVQASEAQVQQALAPYTAQVAIAAVNAPTNTVISGEQAAVQQMVDQLKQDGIKCTALKVSHAFHSPLLEPMLAEFAEIANTITYHPPKIPLVANLTGQLATETTIDGQYWVRHAREPVRFADGIQYLGQAGVSLFVELGPKPTLSGLVQHCFTGTEAPTTLPCLRPNRPNVQTMLHCVAGLYQQGFVVGWTGFYQNIPHTKLALPTYPFQRKRYWMDTAVSGASRWVDSGAYPAQPLINQVINSPLLQQIVGETTLSVERFPFLNDHRVFGEVVSPGAC